MESLRLIFQLNYVQRRNKWNYKNNWGPWLDCGWGNGCLKRWTLNRWIRAHSREEKTFQRTLEPQRLSEREAVKVRWWLVTWVLSIMHGRWIMSVGQGEFGRNGLWWTDCVIEGLCTLCYKWTGDLQYLLIKRKYPYLLNSNIVSSTMFHKYLPWIHRVILTYPLAVMNISREEK